jgi:VWFA-related protein
LLVALGFSASRLFAQQPVQESVHVTVVEVTVHASDRSGEPLTGLEAGDLRLFVDKKLVPIDGFEWMSSEPPAAVPKEDAEPAAPPAPRLIVLFFQWHIEASKAEGHVRMSRQALEFIDTLKPGDRAAVVTFGSRLWLRQDFTNDRALLQSAIRSALALENAPVSAQAPSLDAVVRDGAAATSIEKAFIALGNALRPLPGSKAILFFGWGIGRFDFLTPDSRSGSMRYSPEYDQAVAALGKAQAPVFSLDVSGGHHQLEAGLERLSFETGGYYLPTYDFPRWAMRTVARAITGHYVLTFRPPAGEHGIHDIRLEAPGGVRLLYRQAYED